LCTEVAHKTLRPLTNVVLRSVSVTEALPIEMAPRGSFSFPKARRLTHPSQYERVKRDGLTRRSRHLMLSVLPIENCGQWCAGFVTSRRLGGAVIRNRIRRRLREIVRQHQHELRGGFWFVLVARHEAATATYGVLEHELLRLARRASILL
jgi:ribonuclease P protein component